MRRYPRAAPVMKTERKDNCVANFLHRSAQVCFYHTPGLRQPHITTVFLYCDEGVGQSASLAHAVDISWRSCSFRPLLSVADVNLAVSDCHIADCFSGRLALHVPTVYIRFFVF